MNNKILKIIGLIVFLILGKFFVPKLLSLTENAQSRLNKEILSYSFNGIVTDKFIDKFNHSQCVIIINNTVRFELQKREYYHYMEIGDRIIKNIDEYNINIHKKDTVYIFNLRLGNDDNELE